jgi:hypothetical protein
MRSSIGVLYILLFCCSAVVSAQSDADALYRERATAGKAEAAASIWEQQLKTNPADIDAAWKLSRAMYWIGTHGVTEARRPALERGVSAGRQAATLAPARPEGHCWMAANMGSLAESFGMRQGLR